MPQDGGAVRVVSDLFFPLLFVAFGLVSAALIATITASAGGSVPRWIVYAGMVAVFGSIAGVVFIPFVLPLLWYLAVAILGFARSRPATPATPPPPPPPTA